MNEKDIREQKINFLFHREPRENVYELKSICENFDTNFNSKELDVFKKLGKTFKVYNEIKTIKNIDGIDEYIKEKKKKYLYKIVYFYLNKDNKKITKYDKNLTEENIMGLFGENFTKFLSFRIDYNYKKSEINKIIEFIPFRFFDIIEEIVKKEQIYNVKTSFPLIDEILHDIYTYLIVKKDFAAFQKMEDEKGSSAYSTLFEYRVRYTFNPKFNGSIHYFTNFSIQENAKMKVIIPKDKEIKKPKFIQKLILNKCYLIEQEQFGGKDLDFLIINMSKDPQAFGFQVSTYKDEIFNSLEKTYKTLIERLNICFNIIIKKEDAYFGYIFDYSRIDDNLYKKMIKDCELYKMKYSYFDTKTNSLYIRKNKKTNDITQITGKPLTTKIDINFTKKENIENYYPLSQLNFGKINTIIDILRNERKDCNISGLVFKSLENNIPLDDDLVSIVKTLYDQLLIFFKVDNYLVSKIIYSDSSYENNYSYFSDKYEVYKIL